MNLKVVYHYKYCNVSIFEQNTIYIYVPNEKCRWKGRGVERNKCGETNVKHKIHGSNI